MDNQPPQKDLPPTPSPATPPPLPPVQSAPPVAPPASAVSPISPAPQPVAPPQSLPDQNMPAPMRADPLRQQVSSGPDITENKRLLYIAIGVVLFLILGAIIYVIADSIWGNKPTGGPLNQNAQLPKATDWATEDTYAGLVNCTNNPVLNRLPVDFDEGLLIVPVGGVFVPDGDVLPIDHSTFLISNKSTIGNKNYTIFAPGTMRLTKVKVLKQTKDGIPTEDYSLYFMPCKQVGFWISHVTLTKPIVETAVSKSAQKLPCVEVEVSTGVKATECTTFVDLRLRSGEPVATVAIGPEHLGFHFGVRDSREKSPAVVNPKRLASDNFHGLTPSVVGCPYDYLPNVLRLQALEDIGFVGRPKDAMGCGEIMQDFPDTLGGAWYAYKLEDTPEKKDLLWQKQLAFLHYNKEPGISQVVIGGTLVDPGLVIAFRPKASGNINPDPRTVLSDRLVCFQTDPNVNTTDPIFRGSYGPSNGHTLVQLNKDGLTLQAEYGTGPCTGKQTFSKPVTYYR